MRSVVLLTPTRDRPRSFRLCEKWMGRQTRRAGVEWVVVDDGDVPVQPTMGQIYLRRSPSCLPCTLPQNLLFALGVVGSMKPDAVLFIEDDDWYAPSYVENMLMELEKGRIAGEMRRRYYHLPTRGYLSCYNRKHAALAATAMRGYLVGEAKQACERAIASGSPYVDLHLWRVGPDYKMPPRWQRVEENKSCAGAHLFSRRAISVGIKGSPGRGGLGSGHTKDSYQLFDPTGKILRHWVGNSDAQDILALANPEASCQNAAPVEDRG
jgi:hypothetical protein